MLFNLIITLCILLLNIITISSSSETTSSTSSDIFNKDLPLCVSNTNTYQQVRECEKNDTYCGNWKYLNQVTKEISW